MSNPGYILPPPPALDVPDGVELLTGIREDDHPGLVALQTLENWRRVYEAAALRLTRELWATLPYGEKGKLEVATGMSRAGVRKRADPVYADRANARRRGRGPAHPAPPQTGGSP